MSPRGPVLQTPAFVPAPVLQRAHQVLDRVASGPPCDAVEHKPVMVLTAVQALARGTAIAQLHQREDHQHPRDRIHTVGHALDRAIRENA